LDIGIDFGTTNSSIARANAAGEVEVVQFETGTGLTDAYRSLLYLEQVTEGNLKTVKSWSGPEGVERYLIAANKGRLIQSLKSFLSSKSLKSTEVFGRRRTLEELIARILRDLREKAEKHLGIEIRSAVSGRPVRFVGAARDEDNAHAESRLRDAFRIAGFETVQFELEPVAAAHHYESTLDHDELILIGDFGGGTSDFSLLHVGPGVRGRGRAAKDLLGNSGLGLAGDSFDARIVRKLVSPALGSDSFERSYAQAADRPASIIPAAPAWIYANLERWHYLSFLKTRNVAEILKSARARAQEPEKIAALINLIEEDLGYQLHQAVQRVKMDLSHEETAEFRFRDGSMDIVATVSRADFEGWIADDLQSIERCVDGLLVASNIAAHEVDRVFLTGGTSFVPAVRRIFESRFTPSRVRTGNEFTSVARGLAVRAAEMDASEAEAGLVRGV
jgi:hypothetical chaperone protein